MKKVLLILLTLSILCLGAYVLYRTIMPKIIAQAVVSDTLPDYIPKRLKTRVESMKTPINKGAEAMIQTMHHSNIPLEKVLETVDNITEDQAYAFLDEVNKTQPSTPNEVFDLAKKHFPAEFDPEVFREPFNQHFKIKQIRNALAYANMNRRSNDVDITTAKAILKKIIVEKEKEVSGH
jgi:hypothetical protein